MHSKCGMTSLQRARVATTTTTWLKPWKISMLGMRGSLHMLHTVRQASKNKKRLFQNKQVWDRIASNKY
jgi:hypothetical protein